MPPPQHRRGIGLDSLFIAGLIVYLVLGYYLLTGNFTDSIIKMCNTPPDEKDSSFLYDIFTYIACGLISTASGSTSALALRGLSIMLFLFGVYVWLMLIYFVRYANKPRSPDLYGLSQHALSFGSIFRFLGNLALMGIVSVVVFFLIIGFLHLFSYWTTVTTSIMFLLNVMNAIVILALIYFYFLKQIQWGTKPRTFFELVKHVVFYVPCLFISLVESLTGMYNNTSHTVAVLLGVEAVVITSYFVIPLIVSFLDNRIGTILLKGPVYLNSKRSIGAFEDIHARTEKRENEKPAAPWWAPLSGEKKSVSATDNVDLVPDSPESAKGHYTKWQCAEGIKDHGSRVKCGKDGVSSRECADLDCCWDKISGEKGPSCYKQTTFEGQTEVGTVSFQPEGKKGDTYGVQFTMGGKPSASSVMPRDFTYHYGLMFSYYINPQPASTNANYSKFTNIINYNDCPAVEYKGSTNTFRISMRQGKGSPQVVYETSRGRLQKWNQVFVRYDGGTLDIFIDDELVSSTPSLVPFMTHSDVVVGAKDGINGGIKNVRYFNEDLDRSKISLLHYSS
jgi:hypothetical protein